MPNRPARARPLLVAVFVVVVSISLGFLTAPEAGAASIEAESATTSGTTYISSDSAASGGKAVMLSTTGSRVTYVGATSKLTGITVRAKGTQCFGSPTMRVYVDGTAVFTTNVDAVEWTDYTVNRNLAAGQHSFAVEFTNDFQFFCDRNLLIDKLTEVVASASTTSTTTAPTTTTATTTPATATPLVSATTPAATPVPAAATPAATGCPLNQYRATYYNNITLTGPAAAQRCELSVGGNWSGSPLPGVSSDNFAVDYTGALVFPTTGTYTFAADTGDVGVRVWIDDVLVIDQSNPSTWGRFEVARQVSAGQHTVRVVIVDANGLAREFFSVSPVGQSSGSPNGNYFSQNSFWNNPIPTNAAVDPTSATWVSTLANNSAISEISMNSSVWSFPIYKADASVARSAIRITNTGQTITIPYTSAYRPSPDSDSSFMVVDQPTGCMYDLQGFNASSMTAVAEASYHAYTGSGGHTSGPAHAGGEFARAAGLITPADVQKGSIDHALRFAIPGGGDRYYYPGTRTDGTVQGGPPQGVRIRLDPAVDINSLGLTPFQTMVATALQKYGAFNADTSGSFSWQVPDNRSRQF